MKIKTGITYIWVIFILNKICDKNCFTGRWQLLSYSILSRSIFYHILTHILSYSIPSYPYPVLSIFYPVLDSIFYSVPSILYPVLSISWFILSHSSIALHSLTPYYPYFSIYAFPSGCKDERIKKVHYSQAKMFRNKSINKSERCFVTFYRLLMSSSNNESIIMLRFIFKTDLVDT